MVFVFGGGYLIGGVDDMQGPPRTGEERGEGMRGIRFGKLVIDEGGENGRGRRFQKKEI